MDKKYILVFLTICLSAAMSGCVFRGNPNTKKLNELLREGNKAMAAKDYDKAIEWYDAGLSISPSEPTFLANKSAALIMRGVGRYNASVKIKDEKARDDEKEIAKRDLRTAASLSTYAVKQLKSSKVLEFLDSLLDEQSGRVNIYAARAEALRLVAMIVDKTKSPEALEAMHEYIEIEPNQEKKTKAWLDTGKMLIETGRGDDAVAEYKKVLAINPDHTDALLGVGLALSQSGDLEKYREAEHYLQRFVDQSPDNHPLKTDIKNTLEFMKQENSNKSAR